MGWEQIIALAIEAENIERSNPNAFASRQSDVRRRIGDMGTTALLDRLWERGERVHTERADAETFFVQQLSGRVPGLPRFGNATRGGSGFDDIGSN